MKNSSFALKHALKKRTKKGKEDPGRVNERMGNPKKERPSGALLWIHAASVGEAQSTLILIDRITKQYPQAHILVTTGTVTSAELMAKKLPESAFHQYYPLDHPKWVAQFLDHWKPDAILWMESELWPNMLGEIQNRHIPAALVNAKLSPQSAKNWRILKKEAQRLLGTFKVILTQTEEYQSYFTELGAKNVTAAGNLKYSAAPLDCDQKEYDRLNKATSERTIWLYASTHSGEEEIACNIHRLLSKDINNLLTIIVPRHPERRKDIEKLAEKYSVSMKFRGSGHQMPDETHDIYVADTIGELGLFYRLAPLACIGRSLSNDGGGGHNPIEAAQLDCAILHGPLVQNLQQIYDGFDEAGAAIYVESEKDLQNRIQKLLADPDGLNALQNRSQSYVQQQAAVIDTIMNKLETMLSALDNSDISPQSQSSHATDQNT